MRVGPLSAYFLGGKMSKYYYIVAGEKIIIEYDEDIIIEKFKIFESAPFEEPDVYIRAEKGIPSGDGSDLIYKEDRGLIWHRRNNGHGRFEFF